MDYFSNFIYLFILIQLLFIAVYDVKHRIISNQWSLLNIGLFIGFLFIAPEHYALNLKTFFYSFTFLGIGLVAFAMRIMGAGDSKYLFSLFLITPLVWHDQLFMVLLYSTMIIGGFSFITQVAGNFEKMVAYAKSGYAAGIRECLGKKFPYAPVILMSWLAMGQIFYL